MKKIILAGLSFIIVTGFSACRQQNEKATPANSKVETDANPKTSKEDDSIKGE